MSRKLPVRVAVVNVALMTGTDDGAPSPTDYKRLFRSAFQLRTPIRVHGDRALMLRSIEGEGENTLRGTIAAFTKIEIDDEWFNSLTNEAATAHELQEISLPNYLLPHYRLFNFVFNLRTHKLAVETLSEPRIGKQRRELRPSLLKRFLVGLFEQERLVEAFGQTSVTVIPDRDAVSAIIRWRRANKIEIHLCPPNPDDEDLEGRIVERMRRQNVGKALHVLKAPSKTTLSPDEETKAMMRVAARNGRVTAIGYAVDGKKETKSTEDVPAIWERQYDPETETHVETARSLAEEAISKVVARSPEGEDAA